MKETNAELHRRMLWEQRKWIERCLSNGGYNGVNGPAIYRADVDELRRIEVLVESDRCYEAVKKGSKKIQAAALEMHVVLREINAFFEEGTPVSPSAMYSDDETLAQVVSRILRQTEEPVQKNPNVVIRRESMGGPR